MANNPNEVTVTARLLPTYQFIGNSGGVASNPVTPGQGAYDSLSIDDRPPPIDDPSSQPVIAPPPISQEDEPQTQFGKNAVAAFRIAVSRIHMALSNADGSASAQTKDGKQITLSDAFSNWIELTYQITTSKVYPSGYAGGTTRSDEYGHVSQIDQKLAIENNYALQAGDGLYWLALYELVHTLKPVDDFLSNKYQDFLDRGGRAADWGKSTPEFKEVEQYDNYIERQIANLLGVPTLQNPPLGE